MIKSRTKEAILAILMFTFSMTIFLGCSVPSSPPVGYAYGGLNGAPIITSNGRGVGFGFDRQFSQVQALDRIEYQWNSFFVYDYFVHYILGNEFSVFKSILEEQDIRGSIILHEQSEKIGYLISKTDSNRDSFAFDIIFADGHYVYYMLVERRDFRDGFWFLPNDFRNSAMFFKYSFFRFDLRAGNNYTVELEQFFERLLIHYVPFVPTDQYTLELNPNFKIRQ